MAQIVAFVSFSTGWPRSQVLSMTLCEMLDTYRYVVDWIKLQAAANAAQIAKLFSQPEAEEAPEPDGVEWMMKHNPTVVS